MMTVTEIWVGGTLVLPALFFSIGQNSGIFYTSPSLLVQRIRGMNGLIYEPISAVEDWQPGVFRFSGNNYNNYKDCILKRIYKKKNL